MKEDNQHERSSNRMNTISLLPIGIHTNKLKLLWCDSCGKATEKIIKVEIKERVNKQVTTLTGRDRQQNLIETKICWFCEKDFSTIHPGFNIKELKELGL